MNPSSLETDWLEIGQIVAAQGLKGEVRVYPNSDFPERFEQPGTRWLLRANATQPEAIKLERGRAIAGKGIYVVKLAGVDDRTQAETLRGAKLLVTADDRPSLAENEFHVSDLIGLEVIDQATQTPIGTVVSMISAGNDLLEVKRHQPQTHSASVENATHQQTAPVEPEPSAPQSSAPNTSGPNASGQDFTRRKGKTAQARQKARQQKAPSADATILIPFVEEIVPIVDLENGQIQINPPAGLLDI